MKVYKDVACENIRFFSLFAAADVSWGGIVGEFLGRIKM